MKYYKVDDEVIGKRTSKTLVGSDTVTVVAGIGAVLVFFGALTPDEAAQAGEMVGSLATLVERATAAVLAGGAVAAQLFRFLRTAV